MMIGAAGKPHRAATQGVKRNGTVFAAAAEGRTHCETWAESRVNTRASGGATARLCATDGGGIDGDNATQFV